MRMVTAEELTAALKKMKQMKFSDDECEWLAVAANTFGRDRFDPVALIEMAAVKRGVELDLANRDFRRAVAIGVEETHLDAKTMAEFKARAMQLELEVKRILDANRKYEEKMWKMRSQRDELEDQVKWKNEEIYRMKQKHWRLP